MKNNISRSSIFRDAMRIKAEERKKEIEEKSSKKVKTLRSEYFYSARKTELPKTEKSIGKEPGE